MVTVLKDGTMVEVATVGREGMLGVSAILNGDPSPPAVQNRPCRSADSAVRISRNWYGSPGFFERGV